MAIIRHL